MPLEGEVRIYGLLCHTWGISNSREFQVCAIKYMDFNQMKNTNDLGLLRSMHEGDFLRTLSYKTLIQRFVCNKPIFGYSKCISGAKRFQLIFQTIHGLEIFLEDIHNNHTKLLTEVFKPLDHKY